MFDNEAVTQGVKAVSRFASNAWSYRLVWFEEILGAGFLAGYVIVGLGRYLGSEVG